MKTGEIRPLLSITVQEDNEAGGKPDNLQSDPKPAPGTVIKRSHLTGESVSQQALASFPKTVRGREPAQLNIPSAAKEQSEAERPKSDNSNPPPPPLSTGENSFAQQARFKSPRKFPGGPRYDSGTQTVPKIVRRTL